MIIEDVITTYTVICDRCKKELEPFFVLGPGGITHLQYSLEEIKDRIKLAGWTTISINNQHFCPSCIKEARNEKE